MKKLAVLISSAGTGTNLQAIIDAINSKKLNAKIVLVISDSQDAQGLKRAEENNIPTLVLETNNFGQNNSKDNNKLVYKKKLRRKNVHEGNLVSYLKGQDIDYICLAGWKQIISDSFIKAFPKRILNTHPGLIPDTLDGVVKNPDGTDALWNKGKLTTKAVQNFLDKKATYAGCTNHFLSNEFDFGPVLGRCFEKILDGDSVETLYSRLKKKENQLYVKVLQKLCNSTLSS